MKQLIPLLESLSSVVYYTPGRLNNLRDILKSNTLRLSVAFGTPSDMKTNFGKLYFLSLSRMKFGGYARSEFFKDNPSANMVLDGGKLNQVHKGKAIDYWGPDFRPQPGSKSFEMDRFLRNYEAEDRLITDKDQIKNIKKYIKEVHIYIPSDVSPRDTAAMIEINKLFSPVYFYTDENAFKLLDKRRAKQYGSSEMRVLQQTDDKFSRDMGNLRNRSLNALVDVWKYASGQNVKLNSDAKELEYKLRYNGGDDFWLNDYRQSFEADIHNNKTNPKARDTIRNVGVVIRKTKSKSVKEFLGKLHVMLKNKGK